MEFQLVLHIFLLTSALHCWARPPSTSPTIVNVFHLFWYAHLPFSLISDPQQRQIMLVLVFEKYGNGRTIVRFTKTLWPSLNYLLRRQNSDPERRMLVSL